jgi:hypothetical protein
VRAPDRQEKTDCGPTKEESEGDGMNKCPPTNQLREKDGKDREEVGPQKGDFTLEELCRSMWQHDKKAYLEMANGDVSFMRHLIPQFEREDAVRSAR